MQPSETIVRSPTRRRFQFRLRTLMIVTTLLCGICAYSFHWYHAVQRAESCRIELYRTYIALMHPQIDGPPYRTPTSNPWKPQIQAARNWCIAESAIPFADRKDACKTYLEFVNLARPDDASFPPPRQRDFDWFRKYQQEADAWVAAGVATGEPTPIDENKPE